MAVAVAVAGSLGTHQGEPMGNVGCGRRAAGAGGTRTVREWKVGKWCLRRMGPRPQTLEVPYQELCWASAPGTRAPPCRVPPESVGCQGSSYCLPTGQCRPPCCWVAPEGCGHCPKVRDEWPRSQERLLVSPACLVRALCWVSGQEWPFLGTVSKHPPRPPPPVSHAVLVEPWSQAVSSVWKTLP